LPLVLMITPPNELGRFNADDIQSARLLSN
jgi:hypothetical protein